MAIAIRLLVTSISKTNEGFVLSEIDTRQVHPCSGTLVMSLNCNDRKNINNNYLKRKNTFSMDENGC